MDLRDCLWWHCSQCLWGPVTATAAAGGYDFSQTVLAATGACE